MDKTSQFLSGWVKSLRDNHTRLDKKKSGDGGLELTEREEWIMALSRTWDRFAILYYTPGSGKPVVEDTIIIRQTSEASSWSVVGKRIGARETYGTTFSASVSSESL